LGRSFARADSVDNSEGGMHGGRDASQDDQRTFSHLLYGLPKTDSNP
jgi:hypothetical protein